MSDVVVMLPGIMGSVLQKDGRDVWALNGSALLNALRTAGGSIAALQLFDDPVDQDDLKDGIRATRVVPDLHLVPGFWKIDGYTKLSRSITESFDVEPGRNFFEFAYDWRRDNRVAARRLGRVAREWLKSWRARSGKADAKLILIAHSMGGLVSRYFLELLDGWKDTRMLVTFGTPYRGSLDALNFLSNGFPKSLRSIPMADLSRLLGSFTSVYQLLPTYGCFDPGNGTIVRVGEAAGIPNVDATRAARALAFHNEIAAAVDAHRREDEYVRAGYAIHPVVGTYQATLQAARLVAGKVEVLWKHPSDRDDVAGDGTVPRPSASPRELDGREHGVYVAQTHSSLQNDEFVLKHLDGLLSAAAINTALYRAGDVVGTRIVVEDAYTADEPVTIRSTSSGVPVDPHVIVADAGSNTILARANLRDDGEGAFYTELAPLPEGAYRVTVNGYSTPPATDVFIVASR